MTTDRIVAWIAIAALLALVLILMFEKHEPLHAKPAVCFPAPEQCGMTPETARAVVLGAVQ